MTPSGNFVPALDQGTTSSRAIVCDRTGTAVASAPSDVNGCAGWKKAVDRSLEWES